MISAGAHAQRAPRDPASSRTPSAATANPLAQPTSTARLFLSRALGASPDAAVRDRWNALAFGAGLIDFRAANGLIEGVDPARPIRMWVGALDEGAEAFAVRARDIAAEIPATTDRAALAAPGGGALGQRMSDWLTDCRPGGFARRTAIPTARPAQLSRAVRSALLARRWTAGGAQDTLVSARAGTTARIHVEGRYVVVDEWQEVNVECQSEANRRALVQRARARLAAIPRAVDESANDGESSAVLTLETDERAMGRQGLLVGMVSVLSAVAWGHPDEGPALAPAVRQRLVLQGIREAAAAARLAGDGARFVRTSVRVNGDASSRTTTIVSELGSDATVAPTASSFAEGPSIAVVGAQEYIDLRASWLDGFGPARDSATLLGERANAGWGAMFVAMPLVFVAALRARIESARPSGAPWPATARIDRVVLATLPAHSEHPVSIALLTPSTTAERAACALVGDRCPRGSELTAAIRAVQGGFARLIDIGDRRAIALCTTRAPLEALTLRPVARVGPAVGTLVARERDPASLFVEGPRGASFSFERADARLTLTLRSAAN